MSMVYAEHCLSLSRQQDSTSEVVSQVGSNSAYLRDMAHGHGLHLRIICRSRLCLSTLCPSRLCVSRLCLSSLCVITLYLAKFVANCCKRGVKVRQRGYHILNSRQEKTQSSRLLAFRPLHAAGAHSRDVPTRVILWNRLTWSCGLDSMLDWERHRCVMRCSTRGPWLCLCATLYMQAHMNKRAPGPSLLRHAAVAAVHNTLRHPEAWQHMNS